MTRVEEVWRDIATQSSRTGLFRRIDETHPLDLYAGIDHQGKRVLLLVTKDTPPILPPPGIVEVACNQRDDQEWAIIVQLARPDFDELFGRLCQDLIDSTRDATPEHGGDVLLRRLGRWRRLLEVGHRRTLSEAELRGLIGELWFLLVEIKTCIPGSDDVTIASLQQLDAAGEPLYLGVIRLAPATSTTPDAFTTAALVTRIRQDIEASQAASTEFELRLADAGYADGEEYARAWYHISGVRYFHVRDDFPRLVPSGVPAGIREVTYTVDLRSCAAFEDDFSARQA